MNTLECKLVNCDDWLVVEHIEEYDRPMLRLAYFYEHYDECNQYRLVDDTGEVVSNGRQNAICHYCNQRKSMLYETPFCHTCLSESFNYDR